MVFAASRPPKYPVYEFHNVHLLKVAEPYRWVLKINGYEVNAFWCHDYDIQNATVPVSGYAIDTLIYEDQMGCWSIKRDGLGIIWHKDPITKLAVIEKEN
jgi:hypothetical protein